MKNLSQAPRNIVGKKRAVSQARKALPCGHPETEDIEFHIKATLPDDVTLDDLTKLAEKTGAEPGRLAGALIKKALEDPRIDELLQPNACEADLGKRAAIDTLVDFVATHVGEADEDTRIVVYLALAELLPIAEQSQNALQLAMKHSQLAAMEMDFRRLLATGCAA